MVAVAENFLKFQKEESKSVDAQVITYALLGDAYRHNFTDFLHFVPTPNVKKGWENIKKGRKIQKNKKRVGKYPPKEELL